jgi:hypothetical protein
LCDWGDTAVDAVNWFLLMVGAGVLLVALLLRAGAHRQGIAAPVEPVARETGLIQSLPAGARPQDSGPAMFCLLDEREPDARGLAITLLDLATRGFLRLGALTEPGLTTVYDWTLHRTARPATGLRRYEATLLTGLFESDGEAARTLTGLAASSRGALDKALDELRGSAREVGWLSGTRARSVWGAVGGVVLLLGLIAIASTLFGVMTLTVSWQSLAGGVCLIVAGVLLVQRTRLRPSWTASGEAARRQVARCRTWLTGVAAHEITLDTASDTLNEHLASAFALDAQQHLADVLDQLVRRATSWSQPVTIDTPWLDPHPDWANDAPLPGQVVALADQFVHDAVRTAERAGVGLGRH